MEVLRTVIRESAPILIATTILLVVAGVAIEHERSSFSSLPALLILVPTTLSGAGAIGGILSSRLSSKLHLGVIAPARVPDRGAQRDIGFAFTLALPVFLGNGLLAALAAQLVGEAGPGVADMVTISLVAGIVSTIAVSVIAYYGTIAAVRLGVDPDTYGIPLVTSAVDLVGAYALVLAITWTGIT